MEKAWKIELGRVNTIRNWVRMSGPHARARIYADFNLYRTRIRGITSYANVGCIESPSTPGAMCHGDDIEKPAIGLLLKKLGMHPSRLCGEKPGRQAEPTASTFPWKRGRQSEGPTCSPRSIPRSWVRLIPDGDHHGRAPDVRLFDNENDG